MPSYSRRPTHFKHHAIKPHVPKQKDLKDAEKQAEIIKNADNSIWERHGWKSGGEIEDDKKKYAVYKRELKARTPKKVNPKVYSLLEDENFHLANRALRENKQFAHTTEKDSASKTKQYIVGGLADKKQPSDFNKKELAKGTKVEMEHTNNPKVAREIAEDHLTEDKKYYEKLERMESGTVIHNRKNVIAEPFHKEDTDMKFNVRTAVLVPSTTNTNEPISREERARRVEETRKYLSEKYGGYTSINATGGYKDDKGNVVKEPVTEVVAYTTKEDYEKNRGATEQWIGEKQKEWKQDSIGYELSESDRLYYFKKNK